MSKHQHFYCWLQWKKPQINLTLFTTHHKTKSVTNDYRCHHKTKLLQNTISQLQNWIEITIGTTKEKNLTRLHLSHTYRIPPVKWVKSCQQTEVTTWHKKSPGTTDLLNKNRFSLFCFHLIMKIRWKKHVYSFKISWIERAAHRFSTCQKKNRLDLSHKKRVTNNHWREGRF